jgi:molybdopterin converting factor small subunit
MGITLKIEPILSQYTEGQEKLEIQAANTVQECCDIFFLTFPAIRPRLFDINNHPVFWVLLNHNLLNLSDLDKKVSDGDEIELLMMFTGG